MVTIKDVAALAGVSNRTVSRVVRNEAKVSRRTRTRVESAIENLGYIPNRAARMVRTRRSGVIGLITDVVATTPFSTDIIRGIQDAIEDTELSLLAVNTAGDRARARRCWRTMREHRIDAMIMVTMFHRHVEQDELDPAVPTVLVNCSYPANPSLTSIVPDDYQGGVTAAKAAWEAGHRKFGYLRLNPNILAADLRERATRDYLRNQGVEINENWFVDGLVGPVFHDEFVAFDNVNTMLAEDDRPTVLLCGNDELALQAICAANAHGISVPSELSIVGFDDFKVISEVIRPQLTSVLLPYCEMGRIAVEVISRMLESPTTSSESRTVPCPLVIRGTLAPPRQAG